MQVALGYGGEPASSVNCLLSMVMMLGMSFAVTVGGGLLGAFEAAGAGEVGVQALPAFRSSFVDTGLVTAASSAIFWQLPPEPPVTHAPARVESVQVS